MKSQKLEKETLEMVNTWLHCSFKMLRQILALLFMFGWKTLVLNATCVVYKYNKHQDFGDGQHMTTLFLQDVKADTCIVIYVWVENFSTKCNLRSI